MFKRYRSRKFQNINNLDSDDIAVNLEGELQISDFVWKGLNEFYYWQKVEALSDEKLNNEKTYASFIVKTQILSFF